MYLLSIAKCLGARQVCKKSYEWLSQHQIFSEIVPDDEALKACVKFSGTFFFLHNIIIVYLKFGL